MDFHPLTLSDREAMQDVTLNAGRRNCKDAWEQPVLQAEGTQKYRLPDLYVKGYELAFELTEYGNALISSSFRLSAIHTV